MIINGRFNKLVITLKTRPFKVLMTLVTLWSFLFNMVSYDFAWAARTPLESTAVGSNRAGSPDSPGFIIKGLSVETFSLPEYMGHIKDSYKGAGLEKIVIHIQDAHCNYAAQHKISEIIEYLNKEYGVDTINLEGGARDYDLSVFTRIYDKTIREKTADYFVKEGLVNGAEYFAINNPEKVSLWGIEDAKLYLDNLNVYRDSLKYKDEVDKHLNALTHILNNLKTKIYSKELLELDIKYSQYKAGTLEFKDYLSFLIQAAKDKAIDIKGFTNIYLLSQTLTEEGNIDFKKANNQRDSLIDKLQKKLSKKSLEELIQKTVEFRSEKIPQKEFYAYLTKKANLVGIELNDSPDLRKYIIYISMYDAINKMKVMGEIDKLESAMKEALFKNDEQKELNKLSKNLAILKNIFNISLTREDYKYYAANKADFNATNYISFINKEAQLYKITAQLDKDITSLDRYREDVSKFYGYSFKRDEIFLKNLRFAIPSLRALNHSLRSGTGRSNLKNTAIVVTGGFHTENLCEIFKKQNISYISIIPAFSNCEGYQCPYFKLLAGKGISLQQKLYPIISPVSSIQIASMLSAAIAPEVWGKANIDAFKAAVLVEEQVARGRDIENIARSGDNVIFHMKNGETEQMSVRALLDAVHQKDIDGQMEKLPESAFEDIQNIDKVLDEIRVFLSSIGANQEVLERVEVLKGKNANGRVLIRLVNGVTFRGHAGGQGIRINGNLKGNDGEMKAVIIHEIIAGMFGDHFLAEKVEQAFRTNHADKNLLAQTQSFATPIWNMTPEQRLQVDRDFAITVADLRSRLDRALLDPNNSLVTISIIAKNCALILERKQEGWEEVLRMLATIFENATVQTIMTFSSASAIEQSVWGKRGLITGTSFELLQAAQKTLDLAREGSGKHVLPNKFARRAARYELPQINKNLNSGEKCGIPSDKLRIVTSTEGIEDGVTFVSEVKITPRTLAAKTINLQLQVDGKFIVNGLDNAVPQELSSGKVLYIRVSSGATGKWSGAYCNLDLTSNPREASLLIRLIDRGLIIENVSVAETIDVDYKEYGYRFEGGEQEVLRMSPSLPPTSIPTETYDLESIAASLDQNERKRIKVEGLGDIEFSGPEIAAGVRARTIIPINPGKNGPLNPMRFRVADGYITSMSNEIGKVVAILESPPPSGEVPISINGSREMVKIERLINIVLQGGTIVETNSAPPHIPNTVSVLPAPTLGSTAVSRTKTEPLDKTAMLMLLKGRFRNTRVPVLLSTGQTVDLGNSEVREGVEAGTISHDGDCFRISDNALAERIQQAISLLESENPPQAIQVKHTSGDQEEIASGDLLKVILAGGRMINQEIPNIATQIVERILSTPAYLNAPKGEYFDVTSFTNFENQYNLEISRDRKAIEVTAPYSFIRIPIPEGLIAEDINTYLLKRLVIQMVVKRVIIGKIANEEKQAVVNSRKPSVNDRIMLVLSLPMVSNVVPNGVISSLKSALEQMKLPENQNDGFIEHQNLPEDFKLVLALILQPGQGTVVPENEGLAQAEESVENRNAATVTALKSEEDPGSRDPIAVVGLPWWIAEELKEKNLNPDAYLATLEKEMSRMLGNKKYGDPTNVHKFKLFFMEKDAVATKDNLQKALDSVKPGQEVVIFTPQINEAPIQIDSASLEKFGSQYTIIPDAYSDIDISKAKGFPDVDARIAITRLIAWCKEAEFRKNTDAQTAALSTLTDYIVALTGEQIPPVTDLKDLLRKIVLLRIRPVDYKDITDWRNSYEAVATAL